jgi:hypothetical protein
MNKGEWYKQFGSGITATYYHILDIIDEETLQVERYEYNSAVKKVVTQEVEHHPAKWWMEQVIQNNIYQVHRENVPFLLLV